VSILLSAVQTRATGAAVLAGAVSIFLIEEYVCGPLKRMRRDKKDLAPQEIQDMARKILWDRTNKRNPFDLLHTCYLDLFGYCRVYDKKKEDYRNFGADAYTQSDGGIYYSSESRKLLYGEKNCQIPYRDLVHEVEHNKGGDNTRLNDKLCKFSHKLSNLAFKLTSKISDNKAIEVDNCRRTIKYLFQQKRFDSVYQAIKDHGTGRDNNYYTQGDLLGLDDLKKKHPEDQFLMAIDNVITKKKTIWDVEKKLRWKVYLRAQGHRAMQHFFMLQPLVKLCYVLVCIAAGTSFSPITLLAIPPIVLSALAFVYMVRLRLTTSSYPIKISKKEAIKALKEMLDNYRKGKLPWTLNTDYQKDVELALELFHQLQERDSLDKYLKTIEV